MIIEYDEQDFEIITTKNFENISYRVVKFSNGFYGIQRKYILMDAVEELWETILVSPEKDVHDIFCDLYKGKATCLTILTAFENSYKLINGEYYELCLEIEGTDEVYTEIIKRKDGDTLLENIKEYNNVRMEYMCKSEDTRLFLNWMLLIMIICLIIYTLKIVIFS